MSSKAVCQFCGSEYAITAETPAKFDCKSCGQLVHVQIPGGQVHGQFTPATGYQGGAVPPAPRASGGKFLMGCGLVALIVIVLFCVGSVGFGFLGYRWAMAELDKFSSEYTDQGYTKFMGQVYKVDEDFDEKRVYVAQVVKLEGDVRNDLAIIAQVAEIEGKVDGNLDFRGQMLHIKRSAEVTGDINVKMGQIIKIDGIVLGEVSGSYQTLQDHRKNKSEKENEAIAAEEAPAEAE